ncbi:cytochrome P450 [Streptomyces sp. NPDC006739]|uniref:cytochrome P450 n=1 Tax=Streptomyces sp. NPDC006739 TaxID=3364763 RepID=UPI0036A54F1F
MRPTTSEGRRRPLLTALPTLRTDPFTPPVDLYRLNEEGPLHRLVYPDGHMGWLVTGHALSRSVLADRRVTARSETRRLPIRRPGADPFLGTPALPGWFVDMDPPQHTRFRRLLAGHFSARRLNSLRCRVQEIVDAHIATMHHTSAPVDLVAAFAVPVPSLVICELLGIPPLFHAAFQHHSATVFSLTASAQESAAAMSALSDRMTEIVRGKRRHPEDDLLSRLTASDLSDEEAAGTGVFLFAAGHETVSSMIALGVFALLCHTEQRNALQRDPDLADSAVEELLRYLTIFQFGVPRTALEDIHLAGESITAGDSITVSLPAANYDRAQFAHEHTMKLDRTNSGNLAFGHGLHRCLGHALARLELRIAYTALLHQLPGLRLAVPARDVRLAHESGFYGVHSLPVTW